MEAGEGNSRHSSHLSVSHPDPYDQRPRDSLDRPYRDSAAMAAASLISPGPAYHTQPPPFFGATLSGGMVSPTDPRRPADEGDSHRQSLQSLPSIQEVIKSAKPSPYSASSTPLPGPPGPPGPSSLPSPFTSSAPQRAFPDTPQDQHPDPRAMHSGASFPRSDAPPAYTDPSRAPAAGRAPPPPGLNAFPGQHPSPPAASMDGFEADQRLVESRQVNGAYSQPQPQPQPAQAQALYAPPPVQLPPGQLPLPPFPPSPRHAAGAPLPSPYDGPRPPAAVHPDEAGFSANGQKYEQTFNRHFQAWSYNEYLAKIATCSRTVFNFADAYSRLATEEHGNNPLPGRLPTEREVGEMISTIDYAKNMLDNLRNLVQQNLVHNQAREVTRAKGPFDEEDVNMYGDGMKPPFDGGFKKRRGRAAPPGRCHSCNRVDTPEWRRGPDGARTLCNACGLHYAKLERKRQSEGRGLRPKASDDR